LVLEANSCPIIQKEISLKPVTTFGKACKDVIVFFVKLVSLSCSTLVQHLAHHPKETGSSPATTAAKAGKKMFFLLNNWPTTIALW